jgi:lambda repressor-like predicted transcriptional regulator
MITPQDEHILALHQQGYSQRAIAGAIGVSQVAIHKRLRKLTDGAALGGDNLAESPPVNPGVGERSSARKTEVICSASPDNPAQEMLTNTDHSQADNLAALHALGEGLAALSTTPSLHDVRAWGRVIVHLCAERTGNR